MTLDNSFKTKTMARIFVEQGQLKKATEIYLHLLKQNPHQLDVKAELAAVRRKMNHDGKGKKDLAPLYREWIRLSLGAESCNGDEL